MASDQELQAKRESVEKLRAQVADAETKRVTAERELSNDITIAQLDAEEARLQAQLAEARRTATKTAVKEGTSNTLAAIRADQAAAREQAKAAEKAATAQGSNDTEKGE